MSGSRILISVLLAFTVYAVYSYFFTSKNEGFDCFESEVAADTIAPLTRIVAPGGPSAPSQQAPRDAPMTVSMDEKPFDPAEESQDSAEIPERLRHPERSFGPGIVNEDTETAAAAGTASFAHQATTQAYQVFGPEFAQNGGLFMDGGVIANDSSVDQSYSSV